MKEEISALMDGELDEETANRLIARFENHEQLRKDWALYHMIGEAIAEPQNLRGSANFDLGKKLQAEPTVLAPVRRKPGKAKFYALAASILAILLVGWVAKQQMEPASIQEASAVDSPYMAAHQELTRDSNISTVAESFEVKGK